jgi:hypothetical protein
MSVSDQRDQSIEVLGDAFEAGFALSVPNCGYFSGQMRARFKVSSPTSGFVTAGHGNNSLPVGHTGSDQVADLRVDVRELRAGTGQFDRAGFV